MTQKRPYNTSLRIICASLFAIFSFLYIYMLQGELLALVQDHLSQGKTTNNALATASIITLLLMIIQYLLAKVSKLHSRYEAFSYLPSCIILALIVKVDSTLSYSWVQWGVAMLVVAAVYMLVVWIDRNTTPQKRETKFLGLLIRNLGVMVTLFIFTGWYGNSNPAQMMELAAWKYTHDGDYNKVLSVGQKSEDCNAGLTALRNLALAKTGQLGDKLFSYPQPYGSDGLMMKKTNMQTPKYGTDEFYKILGIQPNADENAATFYKRMLQETDSTYYYDLYVAALLLDKDIDTIVALTTENGHPIESLSPAPVHIQEAWMMYNEQQPPAPIAFVPDNAVAQRYQEYLALRKANANNPTVMKNLCRRKFGNTYWYYYDLVN